MVLSLAGRTLVDESRLLMIDREITNMYEKITKIQTEI